MAFLINIKLGNHHKLCVYNKSSDFIDNQKTISAYEQNNNGFKYNAYDGRNNYSTKSSF